MNKAEDRFLKKIILLLKHLSMVLGVMSGRLNHFVVVDISSSDIVLSIKTAIS
jgi:hypothetical protein